MNILNFILDLVIFVGIIFVIVLQRRSRKLDKEIEENWKEIEEFGEKIKKEADKAEKFFKDLDKKTTKARLKLEEK
ncbi:MAG: hypothetical protein KAV87_56550 [Desulfobacteraceae bacterium]|nr:hypothetical protein [Desulfobacteraceae bacterium]